MQRTRPAPLLPALLLATLVAGGCRAPAAPPIDMERVRAEGRALQQPPLQALVWTQHGPMGDAPFVWTGDRAELSVVEARVLFVSGRRLVVDAFGSAERRAAFVVDTGTTFTSLSTASPLSETAHVWEASRVAGGGAPAGRLGVVPTMRIGGLTGRDVGVALRPAAHSLERPQNLIGQDLLRGLLLRHAGGRWTLLRRTPEAVAADRPEFVVPLLAPGLPMVRVRDPNGAQRFALIDTGAPMAVPTVRSPRGAWHLEGFRDALPISAAAGTTEGSPHFRLGEWPIALLIGLDSLSAADWVLDLEGAEWRFLGPARSGP